MATGVATGRASAGCGGTTGVPGLEEDAHEARGERGEVVRNHALAAGGPRQDAGKVFGPAQRTVRGQRAVRGHHLVEVHIEMPPAIDMADVVNLVDPVDGAQV